MSERSMIREGDRAPEGGANCMFRCPEWCAECAEMENERLAAVTSEDVRERVLTVLTAIEWAAQLDHPDGGWYACCPWCEGGDPDDDETPPGRAGHAELCELAAVLALLRTPSGERPAGPLDAAEWADLDEAVPLPEPLTDAERAEGLARIRADRMRRTPRGEGEAMDADEMWNHWTSGHEDAALQGLRTATDDEAHRFLDMLARWQKCPKPSDHAARRGEGERGLIMRAMLETFPWSPDIRQAHFERAADAVIAALRSEAQGDADALAAVDMERVPTTQGER